MASQPASAAAAGAPLGAMRNRPPLLAAVAVSPASRTYMLMTDHDARGFLPDLADPIWTVEHAARCSHVSVDHIRTYAGRDDFPPARRLGDAAGRLLWPREEVLNWFLGLPQIPAARRRTQATPIETGPAHDARPPWTTSAKHGAQRSTYRRRPQRATGSDGAAEPAA